MKTCFFLIAFMISIAANAQDSTYKEVVGKYKFPAGSVVEEAIVALNNGMVTISSTAGVSALEKIKGDTFNIVSLNGIAVFKRNDSRKITGVHVDASGYVLDGVKEDVSVSDTRINALEQPATTGDKLKEIRASITRESIAERNVYRTTIIGYIIQ